MMLVDNFKIILLVGLICAAGLRSTEALKCKAYNSSSSSLTDVTCDKSKGCSYKDGVGGCNAAAECKSGDCCAWYDNCNAVYICRKRSKLELVEGCKAIHDKVWKELCKVLRLEGKGCEGLIRERLVEDSANTAGSTTGTSAASTYGGISIPIVTLVSAFLYYIPLNFFL